MFHQEPRRAESPFHTRDIFSRAPTSRGALNHARLLDELAVADFVAGGAPATARAAADGAA
ncbi:MAG: hypothetical protein M5U08_07165 [Burkholderiales bacterium]|nr:hypothetical protein [Burkholderiales bacterium]